MSDSGSFLDRQSFCRTTSASAPTSSSSRVSSPASSVTHSVQQMDMCTNMESQKAVSASSTTDSNNSKGICNIATTLLLRGPDARESASRVVCHNNSSFSSHAGSGGDLYDTQVRGIVSGNGNQDNHATLSFSATYPSWVPGGNGANGTVLYSEHMTNGYQRSACLISNGQAILPSLQVYQCLSICLYLHHALPLFSPCLLGCLCLCLCPCLSCFVPVCCTPSLVLCVRVFVFVFVSVCSVL